MVLWITERDVPDSMSDYKLCFRDFASKEYHPFIATTKWDEVVIDVSDDTPRGIIKQLVPLAVVKPRYDIDKLTIRQIQILCEIYPDEASKMLYYFKKGMMNELKDVLDRVRVVP